MGSQSKYLKPHFSTFGVNDPATSSFDIPNNAKKPQNNKK